MKKTDAIAVVIDPEIPDWWPLAGYAMSAGEQNGNVLALSQDGRVVTIEPVLPGQRTEWIVTVFCAHCGQSDSSVMRLTAGELMAAFALNGPFGLVESPMAIDAEKPNVFRRWRHFLAFDAPGAQAGEPPVAIYITGDIQKKIWNMFCY